METHQRYPAAGPPVLQRELDRVLETTPSFQRLDAPVRRGLRDSLGKVLGFITENPTAVSDSLMASQLEPMTDLQRRLSVGGGGQSAPAPQNDPAGQPESSSQISAPTAAAPVSAAAPGGSNTGAVSRVGDATRATLNAIDFPQFCTALIQGVFQSIVESHISQMEAYAKLLASVAQTVDQFMVDNVTKDSARDYLSNQYDGILRTDTSSGKPRLKVTDGAAATGEMPGFFKDLGIGSPDDLDDDTIEQKVVPAARQEMARQRQQTLATMVLLGLNRVIISDGEISARLQFHIDASESTRIKFDQNKVSTGTMAGRAGNNPYSAQTLMVNTTSLNAQSDINIRADLTGQVKVNFKTDAFPLDKFADTAAIQLINQNARVPAVVPAAAAVAPGTAAAAPPAILPPPSARAKSASAAANGVDPWAPR